MSSPIRVYWDTCAFLALLNEEDNRVDVLSQIYGMAQRGEYEIWTSTLTVVECRKLSSERSKAKPLSSENHETIRALFRQDCIKLITLTAEIADTARAKIRELNGLSKWQDAVHLASALRFNLETMHTYDADDLQHLSGSLFGKDGVTALEIVEPNLSGHTIDLYNA